MSRATREAARWFARMQDAAGTDTPMHTAFERWLRAHPSHAEEYQALCTLWSDFDSIERTRALAQNLALTRSARRSRRLRGASVAVLILGLCGALLPRAWDFWQTQPLDTLALSTGAGEVRTAMLPDGSRVVLGADSRLTLRYSRRERQLQLERGEAQFDVRHEDGDNPRAFRVEAGAATVAVLGTRFVVAHGSDTIQVTVERGLTRVSGATSALDVGAGQAADVAASGVLRRVSRTTDEAADFTAGRIVFRDASLGEIAQTLSRYRGVPVRTLPGDGGPRITAVVQTEDVERFIALLPRIAAINVVDDATETRLVPR